MFHTACGWPSWSFQSAESLISPFLFQMLHNSHVSPKRMKSYIYHDNRAILSKGDCVLNHTKDLVHPIHLVSCPSHSYDTMQIPGLLSPSPLSTQRCCDVESTLMTLIQRRSNVLCSVGILHQKNQFTQQSQVADTTLDYCCSTVCDAGPTLAHHQVTVSSCLGRLRMCLIVGRTY